MSRKWYVVQTYSGYENSVKLDLERRIKSMSMEDKIYTILIPEEEYEDTKKDGSKVMKMRKMFPGYIFVEMEVEREVDEKAWFIIRNTPKVTGFLGSSGGGTKPIPVKNEEINEILRKIGKFEKPSLDIEIGEKVSIISGPWSGQIGEVHSLNEEKETIMVLIEIFGRRAPSEFRIDEIRKLN